MSVPPYPQPPWPHPGPGPTPRRPKDKPAAGADRAARIPWGWLEWLIILQMLVPGLLFVPGLFKLRTLTRVAVYLLPMWAWFRVASAPRPIAARGSFPAKPWLIACVAWLVLSLAHPNTISLYIGVGHILMYITMLSPAFWAGEALKSPRQLSRLMAVLFLCNALSSTLGLLQVYQPERFNPPDSLAFKNVFGGEDLMVESVDGRRFLRPCGLSDNPGAAAPAGAVAALIGLCWAIRPIAVWKRLACAALAFIGVAVIYYTQIRSILLVLVICFITMSTLLLLQGSIRSALTLAGGGVAMVIGSLLWVGRTLGSRVFERFGTLVSRDPGQLYYSSRGAFVEHALGTAIWDYPLGYGLGWWGMVYATFRSSNLVSPIWVEVMIPAWVYDGGFPLLIGYAGAVVVAVYDTLRIALTSRDREVGFWAAAIVAQNVSFVALCFSFTTFVTPVGMQFWLLTAALHEADARTRTGPPRPGPRWRKTRTSPGPPDRDAR